jgi:hypothetical protein
MWRFWAKSIVGLLCMYGVVVIVFKLSNIGFLCEIFAPYGSNDFKL